MLLYVVALGVLLASHESLVHAKEALVLTESAIMRSPKFIVRFISARIVNSLALGLMKLREVQVDQVGLVALLNDDLLLFIHFLVTTIISIVLSIGSIHHELLGNAVRLNDNVLN